MAELKADKAAYTINNDGTLEKWYVERPFYEGQVILRKQPRPRWHDIFRGFKPEDVYATFKDAKAALKAKTKTELPKYVIDMMKRSFYYYNFDMLNADAAESCAEGYTIVIKKATPYKRAETLCKEVERLQKWVNRQSGGDCRIIKLPEETTNGDQYAIVTIFDPVMKRLEKYIHP